LPADKFLIAFRWGHDASGEHDVRHRSVSANLYLWGPVQREPIDSPISQSDVEDVMHLEHILTASLIGWSVIPGTALAQTLSSRGALPQSSTEEQQVAPDTRVRGYWVDLSSGLMWAATDNFERDLRWPQAVKYCRDLRLAGYADWRLATIEELEGIYDHGARALGRGDKPGQKPPLFHVKGDLLLNGLEWSASRSLDPDDGRPTGWAYRFDFINGGRFKDEEKFHAGLRALCVRGDVRH
jgi:hypothetical protein